MNGTQFCSVDGQNLAYHRTGKGESLLLVHGITTYSFIWRKIVPRLSENFDVLSIDLLGCGDSDKPQGADLSIAAQARLLTKFLKSLSIHKIHLICHDIGGGIGQLMAIENPDILKDLTLINTVGYDYWPVQPITALRVPFIRILAMASLDHGMLEFILRRGLYHPELLDEELLRLFQRPLQEKAGRQGFLQLAKCIDNRQLTDRVGEIRKIALPTLIIRGVADVYLSAKISEKLHQDITGSRLVNIPTGGHFIQEDEPVRLSRLISEFIEANSID
ncbi:MAG: alpha/beta hydrolase [FCB group bacterium]|nr:alpha/beta hydrolase [FCB group bacterium]